MKKKKSAGSKKGIQSHILPLKMDLLIIINNGSYVTRMKNGIKSLAGFRLTRFFPFFWRNECDQKWRPTSSPRLSFFPSFSPWGCVCIEQLALVVTCWSHFAVIYQSLTKNLHNYLKETGFFDDVSIATLFHWLLLLTPSNWQCWRTVT